MGGLSVEQMEFLADKGLSLSDVIEFARMFERPRSANAERQARYRARKKSYRVTSCDVTGNVTDNVTDNAHSNVTPSLSLPPNENNSNPPTHTHPDNKPARARPAKPDGVNDQTWSDFVDLRKRKRAPITETAMAGIRREAAKAGWALEDALAETVTRGWQSFKAEFVEDKRGPPSRHGEQASYLDHLIAKQGSAR